MNDEIEIENEEDELEVAEVDGDTGSSTRTGGGEGPRYSDAPVEDTSAAAREAMRRQLEDDVQAFLARGGRINEIPPNVVSDPPRKPQSNYGGQPI